ncbi:MAG TPA: 16S rRNA (cytosine(967)-C(5))-methyltransferase RsmB [Burkholderiales bacterium]|nr:16S rRNA (cytosine(967)-C(5))-methyltransferase RsmB [Burkholderiales bacterium]
MLEILRVASGVLGNVLSGRTLDAELATAWRRHPGLTPHERAVVQDVCYGTLRHLGRVDAMLDALVQKPVTDERLRHLLRIAVYALEHTRLAPHAIVDHAVQACVAFGMPAAKGLTNAVLRNLQRQKQRVSAAAVATELGRYSHPQWWIDRVRAEQPACWREILEADNLHPPLTLRVNRRHLSRDAYLEMLTAERIAARPVGADGVVLESPCPVDRIPGFSNGDVSVQDASAQLAAVMLAPAQGSRVLDACTAPGGKAAHILERGEVELHAIDVDETRLDRVRSNLSRLGLSASVACGDAAQPRDWWDGKPYDAILADVPCSASGVVRRHPDIKWLRRPDDIPRYAARQADILDALWQLLGKDGKLLYATCSVFQEENSLQVARFLERHPDARRIDPPGAENLLQQPAGQILPDADHDGFFYALLQRA